MKLKILNEETCPKMLGRTGIARIGFGKSGIVNLNFQAGELMELKTGDKLSLAQDEDEPDNWYLFKDNLKGFVVRAGYDKKGFLFNHMTMIDEFRTHFKLDKTITHNFLLAGQPTLIRGDKTKYWGILVAKK